MVRPLKKTFFLCVSSLRSDTEKVYFLVVRPLRGVKSWDSKDFRCIFIFDIFFNSIITHWNRKKKFENLKFEISQFVPFLIETPQNLSKTCKKGTNCEILNLNSQRLGRSCYITKKSCTDGGNPTTNLILEWPVSYRQLSKLLQLSKRFFFFNNYIALFWFYQKIYAERTTFYF